MSAAGVKGTGPTPWITNSSAAPTCSMWEAQTSAGTLSGSWPASPMRTARSVACPRPVAPSDP